MDKKSITHPRTYNYHFLFDRRFASHPRTTLGGGNPYWPLLYRQFSIGKLLRGETLANVRGQGKYLEKVPYWMSDPTLTLGLTSRRPMMTEFPETQSLLLVNIQSLENREAWSEFVLLYRPAIYRMARRRGMQDSDAQDLTQEVLVRIAKSISNWEARPGIRFRHWLRKVASNAILSALTKSNKQPMAGNSGADQLLAETPETIATSYELEHETLREQFQRAAAIVKSDVSSDTWEAFELTAIRGESCERAAELLEKSIGTIYASRSRILKRLQQEVQRFEEKL